MRRQLQRMTHSNLLKITGLSLVIAALALMSLSCGKTKGNDGAAADDSDDSKWLVGKWSGEFGNKGEGLTLQGPASDVAADFNTDNTFRIALVETPSAYASGTWDVFPGETLVLSLKESTISPLGAKNTKQELRYQRLGDKATIYNDKILLRVKKSGATSAPNPDQPSTPLIGLWKCTDLKSNKWALDIKSETEFWGTITSTSSKNLVIKGTIAPAPDSKQELRFSVVDSNNDSTRGSEFLGILSSDSSVLEIVTLTKASDGSLAQGDRFDCRK